MTKWDTIQEDVADMYIGKIENEEWEKAFLDAQDELDESGLTLEWEMLD